MEPNQAELPKDIPPAVGMQEISEKLESTTLKSSGAVGVGGQSSSQSAKDILSQVDSSAKEGDHNGPIVILMVGMAASGKTTLTQRVTAELIRRGSPPYIINLDPACRDPPYPVNIDIRDTIQYKKVMEVYNLGPNGAIVTSLNLFATKFNDVLGLIEQKRKTHQYVIIDTPGQIEVFMWSASGSIITESLAALFPTVMIYVTDLVTNQNPITFISNMTYACSILYKTKLPLVIALNKRDLADAAYAKSWITDFESYEASLKERDDYASNLASSIALSMDDFYNNIEHVIVSAADGFGMDDFFLSVQKAVAEFETIYKPMYEKLQKERKEELLKAQKGQKIQLKKNLSSAEDESCFVVSGRDAGAGLSLRLDDEDDEPSSEEEGPVQEENEDETFGEFLDKKATTRKDKADKNAQDVLASTAANSKSS